MSMQKLSPNPNGPRPARSNLETLAERVAGAMPVLNADEQRVAVELYRQLSKGSPVSFERLANRLDQTSDGIRAVLEAWPGVYYDDDREIVGFWGLALPEMPHRFEVKGKQLFTWCGWDSLFIPEILVETARIESSCPITKEKITATVGSTRVEQVSPSGTVVSFFTPDAPFDEKVVMSFCHYVLFFASEEAGKEWTAGHENTFLLSVDEAHEVGRLWNRIRLGDVLAGSN